MITEVDLPAATVQFDADAMLAVTYEAQMCAPTDADIAAARELAGALMQHDVVSVQTLIAVQRIQPAATVVFKEDGKVTGVSGQLMLRQSAVRPLFEARFDAIEVDLDHLCRPGEPVALGYAWGIAASTKPAGQAVAQVGFLMRDKLFPNLAAFTRAVTPVGRHIAMSRHGYEPFRHADDDLLIKIPGRQRIAA